MYARSTSDGMHNVSGSRQNFNDHGAAGLKMAGRGFDLCAARRQVDE
jgi:hypothetical protein